MRETVLAFNLTSAPTLALVEAQELNVESRSGAYKMHCIVLNAYGKVNVVEQITFEKEDYFAKNVMLKDENGNPLPPVGRPPGVYERGRIIVTEPDFTDSDSD